MNHGSLYSGIGGWLLAARWAGIENIFTVENDKFCNKILDKHFPNTDRHHDIKEFSGEKYKGAIDILSTSDPCQPFSFAGKRGGTTDNRFLWPETIRVIREIKPSYVVFENVIGFISLAFETVASDLEAEGYTVESFIIPACAVGAWHRRNRLWVVAYSGDRSNRTQSGQEEKTESVQGKYREAGRSGMFSGTSKDAPDTSNTGIKNVREWQNQTPDNNGDKAITNTDKSRLETGQGGEITGNTEQSAWGDAKNGRIWESEPNVGRVVARLSSTLDETIKDYGYKNADYQDAIAKIDQFRREILREMWSNICEVKQTPYRAKTGQGDDPVYEMSCLRTYERWKLGKRIEENKDLSDMWQGILSKPFKETQDLQQGMLERIREIERNEKVASLRVHRLKSLGNSIVPQIALIIFEAIKQYEINNQDIAHN